METMMRQERIRRGWTLEYVGEQVGISKGAVLNMETGRRKPSYDTLLKLEDLFEMTHRELFAPVAKSIQEE